MILSAICIGRAEPQAAKSGLTGHFKRAVTGPVAIAELGVAGDTIVDTKHHGGVDQAVYLFGEPDRMWWAETLGRPAPAGFFGENLSITNLASAELRLGDTMAIGDVLLQITAPRIPCATWAAHIGNNGAVRDFFVAARPGAYARVLSAGAVTAGDPVVHSPFHGPTVTIADALRMAIETRKPRAYLERLLQVPAHHKMHRDAKAALDG